MIGGLAVRAHIIEGRLMWVMKMGGLSLALKVIANAALVSFGLFGLSLASSIMWLIIPSAHLWRLRDTLSQATTRGAWLPLVLLATCCLFIGIGWERFVSPPSSLTDPNTVLCLSMWLLLQGLGLSLLRGKARG